MSAVLSAPAGVPRPASAAVLPADAAIFHCADRLRMSRERLRQALIDGAKRGTPAAPDASGEPATPWLDRLKAVPGAAVVMEALQAWWRSHPLRIATMIGADASLAVLQPLARRHPVALVLGAALLGGLFAWSRPWRWLLKPALFAGLMPQLLAKAVAHVPSLSWMAVLAALSKEPLAPSKEPQAPSKEPQAPSAPQASALASKNA